MGGVPMRSDSDSGGTPTLTAASYTPGPWRYATESSGKNYSRTGQVFHVLANGSNTYVASVGPLGQASEPTANANARLIAAAPELLAALTDLLNAYFPESTSGARSYWKAAEAAIAKAEGK